MDIQLPTDEQVVDEEPAADAEPRRRRFDSAQIALIVFALWIAVALPIILFGVGRYYWFFADDFWLFTGRDLGSMNDLFRPHNRSHWSTMPTIVWNVMFDLFGLRSYRPYQFLVVAMHLGVCVLLRVIMRRHGVGPWIATAAAGSFILFGPGRQNILWAFQIGFTGAVLFGLAHLVLADHDGFDRRDGVGVLFGLLALMSAGVGVTMAIIVGFATLAKRGWQAALVHTAPLGLAFVVWFLVVHPESTSTSGRPGFGTLVRWVWSAEAGVFDALAKFTPVAILLGIVFVSGLALAWARLPWKTLRREAAIPVAMLLGGVLFSVTTALARWTYGSDYARSSRYVYICAALALPAIAIAANAFAKRWRLLTIPMIVLLVVGVPWNARDFEEWPFDGAYMAHTRAMLTNVLRLPEADEVPAAARPIDFGLFSPGLNIGFLRDAERDGKLELADGPIPNDLRDELRIHLAFDQSKTGGELTDSAQVAAPFELRPEPGDRIGFLFVPVHVSIRREDGTWSEPVTLRPGAGGIVTFRLDADLRFAPAPGEAAMGVCAVTPGPTPARITPES